MGFPLARSEAHPLWTEAAAVLNVAGVHVWEQAPPMNESTDARNERQPRSPHVNRGDSRGVTMLPLAEMTPTRPMMLAHDPKGLVTRPVAEAWHEAERLPRAELA